MNLQNKPIDVRVRVAFVPLQSTFIGLPRALLFNMLYRDSVNGKIILRIDDTDVNRACPDRLREILDCLHWLGIEWNEGPDIDGPYAPYIQSKRHSNYDIAVNQLLEKGQAYHCFCHHSGEDHGCLGDCPTLELQEAKRRIGTGKKSCIRFKIRDSLDTFTDLIHGNITKDMSVVQDPVIVRQDGTPMFHLATAVDEIAFNISHVLRGVDHIESTFVQQQIIEALGGKAPQYMHFSIYINDNINIYNENKKEIYNLEYLRSAGFLSRAIQNFLLTSGYTPNGTEDSSLYTYHDFCSFYCINHFSLSNQHYDFLRLIALNRKWLHSITNVEYLQEVHTYFVHIGYTSLGSDGLLLAMKSHIEKMSDLLIKMKALFSTEGGYVYSIAGLLTGKQILLSYLVKEMENIHIWNEKNIKIAIQNVTKYFTPKDCYESLRTALTGTEHFGGIIEIATLVGRETVLFRLAALIKLI
jgi:glutamyl/glutaminyl-tRNA synthetase